MALMAAHGEITPMPDCAIFADTGAEPRRVYEWLEQLIRLLPFQVHRVGPGDLRETIFAAMNGAGAWMADRRSLSPGGNATPAMHGGFQDRSDKKKGPRS